MLKVYVISLQTDIERRQLIREKLDHLEIPFEFLDAVYGGTLSGNFISQLNSAGRSLARGFHPTPGEVGCTLSHLKLYELLQCADQEWACVLEDDAILDERMYSFFINFNEKIRLLDKQSLYLMGGQNGLPGSRLVIKSALNIIKIGNTTFKKITYGGNYLARTCCYVIHKQLARGILDLSTEYFLLADDWEFLQKNNIIQSVYLANFIDHPLDLSVSHIEKERQQAEKAHNLIITDVRSSRGILYKIKLRLYKVKSYLKFCIVQFYRLKR